MLHGTPQRFLGERAGMSESAGPSRRVAITLAVITGLAFVGILVGLALGMLAVAGICGMVLVLMWFVLMGLKKRG